MQTQIQNSAGHQNCLFHDGSHIFWKAALHQQYYTKAFEPATRTIDSFDPDGITEVDKYLPLVISSKTKVVEGKAWVVPGILSPQVSFFLLQIFKFFNRVKIPQKNLDILDLDRKYTSLN